MRHQDSTQAGKALSLQLQANEVNGLDAESYIEKQEAPDNNPWVNCLTTADTALVANGQWLNDKLVNASQQLLKHHFPLVNGCQNALLGQSLHYNVMTKE